MTDKRQFPHFVACVKARMLWCVSKRLTRLQDSCKFSGLSIVTGT